MLNKELLMGDSNEQRPVMVTVASFVDPGDNLQIGYSRQYFHIEEVDPLPYWVSEGAEPLYLKYLRADSAGKGTYPFQLNGNSTPFTGIILRADTGKAVSYNAYGYAQEHLLTEADVGKTIPVYFDPSPDGYLNP